MFNYLFTFGIAFLGSLLVTPLVRRFAFQFNIIDHPDEHRKLHSGSIPLCGGIAVAIGMSFSLLLFILLSNFWQEWSFQNYRFHISFIVAFAGILLLGIADDKFGLRGRQKAIGQIVIAGVLIFSGLVIEKIQVFGWNIDMGIMTIPFTLFWLLGAINALNLLDGIDGLASSVGIVISIALAFMALMTNHPVDAIIALALAGSLSGFLIYNYPPAKIFLGDAGSMLIGLVIGILAIRSSTKGPATLVMIAPTAILAIPVFDVTMAIIRRKLTGRSIYTTDRGHLHHCLERRGYSNKKTLFTINICCILTASAALASVHYNNEYLAIGGVVIVLGTMVLSRSFGHSECSLLIRRVFRITQSLIPIPKYKMQSTAPMTTRFGGNHEWEELWTTLTEYAERFDLYSVQLNITLPVLREEYHATWARRTNGNHESSWESQIPLLFEKMSVGRLQITGGIQDDSICNSMGELIEGLAPFEIHIQELLGELLNNQQSNKPDLIKSKHHKQPVETSVSV